MAESKPVSKATNAPIVSKRAPAPKIKKGGTAAGSRYGAGTGKGK